MSLNVDTLYEQVRALDRGLVALSANVLETATPVVITVEGQLGFGHDAEDVGQEERRVSFARGNGVRGSRGSPSGVPERATSPERPKRRPFTAEYKLRIVREANAALASGEEGAVGELLRREDELEA
jgi:hypothetical protein